VPVRAPFAALSGFSIQKSMPSFITLTVAALAMNSPYDMLRLRRAKQMKSFASRLGANFGTSELGIHSAAGFLHGRKAVLRRYDVHVLVVDSCGDHAGIVAALLLEIAKSAGAGRGLYVQAASLVPAEREERGSPWHECMGTTCKSLGIEAGVKVAAALRPRDVGSSGGFDVVLTTDLHVLEQVRQLRPRTVSTYCVADFILSATGPDDPDAAAAVAAVIALPKPMRALLASPRGGVLNSHAELPTDSPVGCEAWDAFLAVAVASSLGFTLRLKQSIRSHARSSLVQQLAEHFPTAASLKALEPHAVKRTLSSNLPAGVLSDAELQMTAQAYSAALQIAELGAAEWKPPTLPPGV